MKRATLLLLTFAIIACGFAQPTITGATINPVAGDGFRIIGCDTAGVSKGPAGAGVTWDFSGLETAYTDTISFVACSATPYCDSFPGATLAATLDGTYFDYFVTDTSKFAALGSCDGSYTDRFTDPYAISMYPMTMGTILVDTAVQAIDTSLFIWGIDSFIADGFGTLKLPSGTYTNVLRVHVIYYEKDSVPDAVSPEVTYYRYETYNWYLPGFHFVLLTLDYDTSGSGTPYLYDAWYAHYPLPSTNTKGTTAAAPALHIYPEPATDMVHVQLSSKVNETATITVTDVTGRVVGDVINVPLVAGTNTINYSTASFASGTYMIRIGTASGNYAKRITVNHVN